jgi:hypothetical protein
VKGGSPLNRGEYFVKMLEELAPLLAGLPREASQEIVNALSGIARLEDDLDRARSELERKLALFEAEEITSGASLAGDRE